MGILTSDGMASTAAAVPLEAQKPSLVEWPLQQKNIGARKIVVFKTGKLNIGGGGE